MINMGRVRVGKVSGKDAVQFNYRSHLSFLKEQLKLRNYCRKNEIPYNSDLEGLERVKIELWEKQSELNSVLTEVATIVETEKREARGGN